MPAVQSPPKRPRWVVVLAAGVVLVVLLMIVVMVVGGGHGPERHALDDPDQARQSHAIIRL